MEGKIVKNQEEYTLDGSVDRSGRPAIRSRTGSWGAGILLLVNQGLATLAFFGVGVNLVLYLTRVMGQDNGSAANSVSLNGRAPSTCSPSSAPSLATPIGAVTKLAPFFKPSSSSDWYHYP
ncbi:hypothetical protein ACP275_02G158200 [Erythranthe tilingii]